MRSLVSANGPSVTGGGPPPAPPAHGPPRGEAPPRAPLPGVPDERPLGSEPLAVDELAGPLEPGREVVHVLHVRRDLLRRPLVHGHVVDRGRGAAVVLEQQVLGHRGSLLGAVRPIVVTFTSGTERVTRS